MRFFVVVEIRIGEMYEAKVIRAWNPTRFEIEFVDPKM